MIVIFLNLAPSFPFDFFYTSLFPLTVGLGDPSDLAPLIGGLLFLFGFTSQGGTTILPPSRTINRTQTSQLQLQSLHVCTQIHI